MAHFMSFYGCTLNQIMEKIVIMFGYWVALICILFLFFIEQREQGHWKILFGNIGPSSQAENLIQMHPGSIPCHTAQ